MGFCPNCQKEYGLSVTICPECNALLKEEAASAKVPMFSMQKQESAEGFIEYAKSCGVDCAYEYSSRENAYRIFVSQQEQKRGPKLFAEYCLMESRKKRAAELANAPEKEEPEVEPEAPVEPAPAPSMYIGPISKPKAPVEPEPEIEEPVVYTKRKSSFDISSEEPASTVLNESKPVADDVIEETTDNKDSFMGELSVEDSVIDDYKTDSTEFDNYSTDDTNLDDYKVDDSVVDYQVDDSVIDDYSNETPVIDEPVIDEPVIEEPKAEPVKPVKKPASGFRGSFFDDEFGNFNAPKKEQETKHKDILDLFMNPAQPAPKRDTYATVSQKEEAESRFSVAPGEDPLSAFSNDPFYGKRPKPLVTPAPSPVSDYSFEESAASSEPEDKEPSIEEAVADSTNDSYEASSFDYSYETTTSEDILDSVSDYVVADSFDAETDEVLSSSMAGSTETYNEPSEQATPEPIFVEVKPIADEELDSDNIVDAVDVVTIDKEESKAEEEAEDDAYSAFLSQFREASLKKSMKQSDPAPAVDSALASDSEDASSDVLDSYLSDSESLEASIKNSVVDEILPDKEKYEGLDEYAYISNDSGRPKDIQDTKISVSADSSIIEEVIDSNVEIGKAAKDAPSSVANPNVSGDGLSKSQPRKQPNIKNNDFSDLDEYKGFIPDYSYQEKPQDVVETPEEAAYREFTEKVQERKRANELAESQKQKEHTRKANLEFSIDKKGNKIVFEDTDDLDSYAGFVPDYKPNTSNEDEFDFYKPHTVSSYSKYKKGKKDIVDGSTGIVTHMRATNTDEVKTVFIDKVPGNIKNVIDASLIRSTGFILSMGGKQLATLFNSWLMLNMTASYVKQFEKADASNEENDENKINGIKKVLKATFGDLNESFTDYIVRRYYNKYLDD